MYATVMAARMTTRRFFTVDVAVRGGVNAVVAIAPTRESAFLTLAFAAISPVEITGGVVVVCQTAHDQINERSYVPKMLLMKQSVHIFLTD